MPTIQSDYIELIILENDYSKRLDVLRRIQADISRIQQNTDLSIQVETNPNWKPDMANFYQLVIDGRIRLLLSLLRSECPGIDELLKSDLEIKMITEQIKTLYIDNNQIQILGIF